MAYINSQMSQMTKKWFYGLYQLMNDTFDQKMF